MLVEVSAKCCGRAGCGASEFVFGLGAEWRKQERLHELAGV